MMILVLVSRVPELRLRQVLTLITPIIIVGGWIAITYTAGMRYVSLSSAHGWIATALALFAVGALTRIGR